MIRLNYQKIEINHFPDGTLLLKPNMILLPMEEHTIDWRFENNEEMVALMFLANHLKKLKAKRIDLTMFYIPNARQDRCKSNKDIFTLKYFADFINSIGFDNVYVLDPHSSVSEALFNNLYVYSPKMYIQEAIKAINSDNLSVFYPDEGSMKRYSGLVSMPYAFGIKLRDWETGNILGLEVAGCIDAIRGHDVLIIDDICSRGGTFLHSANKLKELGANKVYLYVSHCENTILEGELLDGDLIERVFTTHSIFTKEHEKIKVFEV